MGLYSYGIHLPPAHMHTHTHTHTLQGAIIEEDIYDAVPDEVKDMMLAEQIQEDDIYDIPPDQGERMS